MIKNNLPEIKDIFYKTKFGQNGYCPYCKQTRRISTKGVRLTCKKCKLHYFSGQYSFLISLLYNDQVIIIYSNVLNKITFNKFSIFNESLYNFEDKDNASFKDFVKEVKKARKYKKLQLFC